MSTNKVARNEKWKNQLWIFVYMSNFEAFRWNFFIKHKLFFLKSMEKAAAPIPKALKTVYQAQTLKLLGVGMVAP